MTKPARHECAFCGRPAKDCARIIMGAVANICDECVGLCVDICAETGDGQPVPRPSVLTARAEAAEARYAEWQAAATAAMAAFPGEPIGPVLTPVDLAARVAIEVAERASQADSYEAAQSTLEDALLEAQRRYAALVAALPECTECDAKATHGHYDAAMFACDEHARDGTRWYEMGHAAIVRADAVRA